MQPALEPRPSDDAIFLHGLLEGVAAVEARAYSLLAELGASPLTQVRRRCHRHRCTRNAAILRGWKSFCDCTSSSQSSLLLFACDHRHTPHSQRKVTPPSLLRDSWPCCPFSLSERLHVASSSPRTGSRKSIKGNFFKLSPKRLATDASERVVDVLI